MKLAIYTLVFIFLLSSCATVEVLPIGNVPKLDNDVKLERITYDPAPEYPKDLFRSGQEGWVQLKVDVTVLGAIENIRVMDYSPYPQFIKPAISMVSKSTYTPVVKSGNPIKVKDHVLLVTFLIEPNI